MSPDAHAQKNGENARETRLIPKVVDELRSQVGLPKIGDERDRCRFRIPRVDPLFV